MDGLLSIALAIWAHEMGLDPNISWGRSRFLLLLAGLVLIVTASLLIYFRKRKDNFFTAAIKSERIQILLSVGHIWLIIFLVYIWFISYGNWTTWNHTTSYYDQLASALTHGKLNIEINPGAALLAAPDPYNPAVRPAFNSEIWDMSIYKGKVYFYWGPVPALLIVPIKLLFGRKIPDNYLVFAFFSGLLVFNSLILLTLRDRFFKKLSYGYVYTGILLAGLVLPILWSVNSPRVYEAAIGASQFFMVGGIFFVLSVFKQPEKIDRGKLFLAGLFWACSVGSRALNVLSILFLVALVVFWILKNSPRQTVWAKSIPEITALMIPLIAGALLLAGYNWARFDSPLEFGFRYQITILDLNKKSNLMFLPDYFLLNLYTYVFQPFEVISKFPFIRPNAIVDSTNPFPIAFPEIYFAGRMVGLLCCAPFLLLSLVHLHPKFGLSQEKNDSGISFSNNFVVSLLAGSFLIGFLGLIFFFFSQMRYIVDIISQIMLLGILGYWKIISAWQTSRSTRSRILLWVAHLFIVSTICISLLLAVSSDYDRLKNFNPVLYEKISNSLNFQQ
jgi:hypothetical protein